MGTILRRSGLAALIATVLVAATVASATASVAYTNFDAVQASNYSSQAFEATSTAEFGGLVGFSAAAVGKRATTVSVIMSSWACQSGNWFANNCATTPGATFNHPITLNIYAPGPGNSVGALLATQTKTFAIPYRPSKSVSCGDGRWADATGACFNGYATPISFDISSLNLILPAKAIVTVAYNTTHYGASPIGASACSVTPQGCGYDSLNVAVGGNTPATGTQPAPHDAYENSTYAGAYCDGGIGGTGTLRLDAGCWAGYQPKVQVEVTSATRLVAAPVLLTGLLAGLKGTLTVADTGAPIPGQVIVMKVRGTPVCSATTNAAGVAQCSVGAASLLATLNLGYDAVYAGNPQYLPSSGPGALALG